MPIQTGDQQIDNTIKGALDNLINTDNADKGILGGSSLIRESAAYDFTSYQFFLNPKNLRYTPPNIFDVLNGIEAPEIPLAVWIDFENFVKQFRNHIQAKVSVSISEKVTKWIDVDDDYVREIVIDEIIASRRLQAMAIQVQNAFRIGMAPDLYEIYSSTTESQKFLYVAISTVNAWINAQLQDMYSNDNELRADEFRKLEDPVFWHEGKQNVIDLLGAFVQVPDDDTSNPEEEEPLPPNYTFDPFKPDSVNFGLQVVHRQTWIPLGTQTGEIIRTLPLGPKQVEKVTVKSMRKSKTSRQTDMSTSVETSTDSSTTVKDSSEIVNEASESFNWNTEANASANWGWGEASLKASMGGENASSSRDTKSNLNETMEKTANKIRKETKIVVTTEVEESNEYTQVSEISNPNDEIAVTYIYSRLERQYEIHTFLSEVNMTVFVAEHIPSPKEIIGSWIRRYDWIISRALLDESFRSDLEVVRNFDSSTLATENEDENIQNLMKEFSDNGLPDYSVMRGKLPDIFQNPQQAYEREVERRRSRQADYEKYLRSVRRLRAHIYDNVLHYCRAIWSSEDPDARMLRYSKIRVPINWEFVPSGTSNGHFIPGTYAPVVYDYAKDTLPLSEIINPAGPIGYSGNYSVFYLKESSRWETLIQALHHQQMPFLQMVVSIEKEGNQNGVNTSGIVSDGRLGEGYYRLVFEMDGADPQFRVFKRNEEGNMEDIGVRAVSQHEAIQFHNIKIWMDPVSSLSVGDVYTVEVKEIPKLVDPELKAISWRSGILDESQEAAFYTSDVIQEFAEYFSSVFTIMQTEQADPPRWNQLSEETRALIRSLYPNYLLRKKYTRRILVDTNNVILTREVDGYSTLEPFKGLHRLADVLDAYADLKKKNLEIQRRQDRLDADLLGDPDIEKVTVVAGSGNIADLAALDGLTEDPTEDDE